jgi:hypothetical protein
MAPRNCCVEEIGKIDDETLGVRPLIFHRLQGKPTPFG